MKRKTRETGIEVVETVPWGMHLCQFYVTKQDFVDILVPYFKTGLENNEFCMWVTSEFFSKKEAGEAMRKAVPNFAECQEKGQVEIVPHTEWYLKDGAFNGSRVVTAWLSKLEQALAKGYDGIRLTGDTAWVGKSDWRDFTSYEKEINEVISKHPMLAICTYSLDKCGASEVVDVISNHQCALIRQAGAWVVIKPMERQWRPSGALGRQKSLTPLQERFVKSGFEALNDQETIELLLSLALPHRECRKLAKKCIELFQNLRGFLTASLQELEQAGLTPHCMFCVKLLHDLPVEVLKEKITEQPIYKFSKEIFDYLSYSMRDLEREVFKVIYLNSQNQIIDTVDLFEGTLESIPIRPREIVESAIKHNATALIVAHNHPSGDPTPSKSDKQLTRDLVFIGMILPIRVLDHIIVGGNRYFSFADEGLVKKYEDNFLNLKIRGVFDTVGDYSEPAAKVYTIASNR